MSRLKFSVLNAKLVKVDMAVNKSYASCIHVMSLKPQECE